MARRKGDRWYIGGLNGSDEARTLSFDLSALIGGNGKITLMKDGAEERSFEIEERSVPMGTDTNIHINCLPRGGFVAVIN